MLKGLRTVVYGVNDLKKAKKWYTKVIGHGPHFDEPFYVGYNVGGYELGLDPDGEPVSESTGVIAYWGVDNIEEEYERLLSLGAEEHENIKNVGGDIHVATLLDPFGNVFGIILNPSFKIEE